MMEKMDDVKDPLKKINIVDDVKGMSKKFDKANKRVLGDVN